MEHLKRLARLELGAAETEALRGELSAILASFEELRELDTEGVEELVRPIFSVNVFRDDAPRPGLSREEALAVAVAHEDGFFKVPRTLE
jgi:aspartyl-tRNA(Asn)/glutamyl-tRNA(Gln) amidotransferase subunit C